MGRLIEEGGAARRTVSVLGGAFARLLNLQREGQWPLPWARTLQGCWFPGVHASTLVPSRSLWCLPLFLSGASEIGEIAFLDVFWQWS